ncbi:MAG: hypothetical protein K2M64_04140 [Clostridia bacterium]|nr:hypothetical protein [Clostridia bacterium]
MAETVKIQIEVTGGIGDNNAIGQVGIDSEQAKTNAQAFLTLDKAMSVSKQFATQIVNRHVSTIGSRTGNYAMQEQVQQGLYLVSKVIDIGVSFAKNPVLGALNLVSEGIDFAFDVAQRNREIAWQNRSAGELARRAGYLSDENR